MGLIDHYEWADDHQKVLSATLVPLTIDVQGFPRIEMTGNEGAMAPTWQP